MKKRHVIGTTLFAGLLSATHATAALKAGDGHTPFWVAAYTQEIDLQVARLLADHGMVVAFRAGDDGGVVTPEVKRAVRVLKSQAPRTPVLMYARASRNLEGQREVGVLAWINQDSRMQVHGRGGRAMQGFGDVASPQYQSRIASSIAGAVKEGGYDGVALDLAVRTPRYKPAPLANLCGQDATFCDRYAKGMDGTLDAIRNALGGGAVLYNGLWNFGPGSVADQQQLLRVSDAAIVEYFGGDAKAPRQSFTQDILPYVEAMASIPADKKLFVFGRGALQYTGYAEDYAWQRYLYCAYLLGARDNTYFKYHATFQADVPQGRTGGLSVYSDWSANLGAPAKAFSQEGGLYARPFAHGLVVVAPDDGRGGRYKLPHAMYSPEGDKLEGQVDLSPGQGLLLLDAKPAAGNDQHLLDLKLLSDWPGASTFADGKASGVALADGAPLGSHDMLLDPIRSAHPRNNLHLSMQAGGQGTKLELVAEVDDPAHRQAYAILQVDAGAATDGRGGTRAIGFRIPRSRGSDFPVVQGGPRLVPGTWQDLDLDGRALFAKANLTFRRWDFVRFDGAAKIRSVALSN